jgi:hypothetical protein
MRRYSAEYWRDRAEEIRAIRDTMRGSEVRRIMAGIARDYDRLRNLALSNSPLKQQQAIDALLSSPFSAVMRKRVSEE